MEDIIITGAENITSEGLTLKLNKPARLREGGMKADEWCVSWDKIGEAIFPGYTQKESVEERDKLRESN